MKKRSVFFMAFVLAFSLVLSACGPKDLTKGKSGKEIVLACNQEVQALKTAAVKMETSLSLPSLHDSVLLNIWITAQGRVSMETQKGHIVFETDFPEMEGTSELYTLIEDNKMMQYFNSAEDPQLWLKMEVPAEKQAEALLSPVSVLKIIEQSLVEAKVIEEVETEDEVSLSVLEMTLKPEAFLKFMKNSSDSHSKALGQILEEKASQGKIIYKMWVRQDNLWPTKMEIDFSDVLKRLLDVDPSMAEQLKPILECMNGNIVITFSDYDKPVNITLPNKVKKNAEDVVNSGAEIEISDLEDLNNIPEISDESTMDPAEE